MFQPGVNAQTAQTLADLMGQGSAGAYMGQQLLEEQAMNPINQQLSLADLDKIQQENAHTRVMNPLIQTVKGSEARKASLQTPEYWTKMLSGDTADADRKVLDLDIARQTKDSKIAQTNSDAHHKIIQNMGADMRNIGLYVSSLPPEEQGPAIRELVKHHGWDKIPGSAQSWEALAGMDPESRIKNLNYVAQQLGQMTPEYIKTIADQELKNTGSLDVANVQASATRYAADARRRDESKAFNTAWMKLGDAQKASTLEMMVEQARATGQTEVELGDHTITLQQAMDLAKKYTQRALELKAASAPQPIVPGLDRTNPAGAAINRLYPGSLSGGGNDPLGIR
jgi:hypothetical protein